MRVSIIAAMTLCGRIGPGFKGSPVDRAFLEEMREKTKASLIGAGTFRYQGCEMKGARGRVPEDRIRAIITASGEIPLESRQIFIDGPRPLIFTLKECVPSLLQLLKGRAEVIGCNSDRVQGGVSLDEVFHYLDDMGANDILVEGGAILNYNVMKSGLCTDLYVTISPKVLGLRGAPSLMDGPEPLGDPTLDLELVDLRHSTQSGEVFLHYRVLKGAR